MSERSATKRRLSASPSPPEGGTSEKVGTLPIERPPRKKGKTESTDGDRLEDGSTINSRSESPHQARTSPGKTWESSPGLDTSFRDTSIPRTSSAMPQTTPSTNPEANSVAVSVSSHPDPINTGTSHSGLHMLTSHNNNEARQQALAVQQSEFHYSIDAFFQESMALSPSSIPPRTNMQRAPSNEPWPQNERLEVSFPSYQQGKMSDMPTTASTASTYFTSSPAAQTTPYNQQRQAYQSSASSFSFPLHQAYPMPTEVTSTIPAHTSTFQMTANPDTGNQRDPPSTVQNMPFSYPRSTPHSAQSGLSFQQHNSVSQSAVSAQPITSPARANLPLQLKMNSPPRDYHSAVPPESISDLPARQQAQAMSEQQTQASDFSTHQRGLRQQDFMISQYHDAGASHARPVESFPNQTALPQHSQVSSGTSSQQRVPPHQRPIITQQLTSIPSYITLEPPPQPDRYSNQMTPIEPTTLSEQHLWSQLETAQLTMVGTLSDLVVRTRNGQADLDVQDRQVRNVTVNLINVMSLWYLLRRDRGWPL